MLSAGLVHVASLCGGAIFLARSGPRGSRRLRAWRRVGYGPCCVPSRAPRSFQGKGGHPPRLWVGRGLAALWPAGRRGGFPISPLWRAVLWPPARTPLLCQRIPRRVYLSGRGCGLAAGAGHGLLPVGLPGGGGGAACVPSSPEVWPVGLVGRGVALPWSVPLPSLGRQQSGCHWRRSGYGGRGPHIAPVRVRVTVRVRVRARVFRHPGNARGRPRTRHRRPHTSQQRSSST